MILFAVVFSYGVSYIAYRGVVGATGVNVAINIIQITALLIFSCMAIDHRWKTKEGDPDWNLTSTNVATQYVQDSTPNMIQDPKFPNDPTKQIADPSGASTPNKVDGDGNPVFVMYLADAKGKLMSDASGNPIPLPTDANGAPPAPWVKKSTELFTLPSASTQPVTLVAGATAIPELNTTSYQGGMVKDSNGVWQFNFHDTAGSVLHWHSWSYVMIQAGVAILILVGFESVTSMGEEAKNPKKDIPKAVILSLIIQGGFCYLFEYFAANYFQSSSYTNQTAAGSSAPIGDMMQLVGAWAFGSANAGWWFMCIQAVTVFLAMVGTTLSCINTGARVTYAMGRDEEVSIHLGLLHGKNNTPHRAIWILATISVVIGIAGCIFCSAGASAPAALDQLTDLEKASIWYKGVFSQATALKYPNGLLTITLMSNFGTFMLYMMSCLCAVVAFHEHHLHNPIKHILIPMFGLIANLVCMIFYLVGPFFVAGMSKKEPFIALGVAAAWGIYGAIYFLGRSKKLGREVILTKPTATVA
jgi:amino acid transporter